MSISQLAALICCKNHNGAAGTGLLVWAALAALGRPLLGRKALRRLGGTFGRRFLIVFCRKVIQRNITNLRNT